MFSPISKRIYFSLPSGFTPNSYVQWRKQPRMPTKPTIFQHSKIHQLPFQSYCRDFQIPRRSLLQAHRWKGRRLGKSVLKGIEVLSRNPDNHLPQFPNRRAKSVDQSAVSNRQQRRRTQYVFENGSLSRDVVVLKMFSKL